MNEYDDIIKLPHHVSVNHKPMTMEARAAQFAPFAALSGYSDAIKETSRITGSRLELDDGLKSMINTKLQIISKHIKDKPEVTITCFVSDQTKSGGSYEKLTGNLKRIDEVGEQIIFTSNIKVLITDIISISCHFIDEEFTEY